MTSNESVVCRSFNLRFNLNKSWPLSQNGKTFFCSSFFNKIQSLLDVELHLHVIIAACIHVHVRIPMANFANTHRGRIKVMMYRTLQMTHSLSLCLLTPLFPFDECKHFIVNFVNTRAIYPWLAFVFVLTGTCLRFAN